LTTLNPELVVKLQSLFTKLQVLLECGCYWTFVVCQLCDLSETLEI